MAQLKYWHLNTFRCGFIAIAGGYLQLLQR